MTKTDIFDEIIMCLEDGKFLSPDTSMDSDTLQSFYKTAVTRTSAKNGSVDSVLHENPVKPAENQAVQIAQPRSVPPELPSLHVPQNSKRNSARELPPVQTFNRDPRLDADMDTLRKLAMDCRTCKLCPTRTNVVFEDGNRDARLMFIGEGPGADEDAAGIPFVGRAGQLLTKMIQAMTFDRQRDVYIANIVKCRPPSNRNPEEDEAVACLPFLRRQIELVHPEVIVLLGAVPLRFLLNIEGISKIRGQWLDYNGIKTMATYHPAFLLRNPRAKIDVWADLQKVMAVFGRRPPQRR